METEGLQVALTNPDNRPVRLDWDKMYYICAAPNSSIAQWGKLKYPELKS